ncbi:MAG: M16 family metallopeptidase, partial [Gemmatimonadales bacterium]
ASAALVAYRPSSAPPFAESVEEMRSALEGDLAEPLAPLTRPKRPSPQPGSRAWSHEREEAGVHVFRTLTGIPVLVQRRAGAIAHLGWFVRGGAVEETAVNAGLTTLMTRTALKGTERRSSQRIAEDAEFLGGVLSAGASADGFQWTISVPVHRLDDAAELLGDVVQRPSFPDDALESERAVALANLASLRDDMYRWPMRLATEAAWSGHPYGQSVLGTEGSLAAATSAALRQWHESRALEAPGALVCVGDIDPGVFAGLAARYFGAIRAVDRADVAAPQWPSAMIYREDVRDKAQSALAMLFPCAARADEGRFAAAMIGGVTSGLGGRFFDELRDRQSLAYSVIASPIVRRRAGAFAAYIAMSPEKEDQARNGLLDQFARLREQPVSDRELLQAQTFALGSWAIRRESSGNVMHDIADAWLFGSSLAELADYEDRVRAVTAQQMLERSREWFQADLRVEGIVRGAGMEV